MSRILVADDNSNIQKMVALALQDQGVEIVGVGNGEAAVRKVPEINPDVILADVFMPVRSGYEVCEFVKNDSRYMHIPVVLLVGAFDPLDEREAQRVRADGVLKKPFVPPEPLVNLVKALLVKSAGERLVAVAVPAASASATAEVARPKPIVETRAQEFGDEPVEELPIPAASLKVSEHNDTVAFGSLLEAPAEELPALDETDPIVTSSRDPTLGEPAFWAHPPQATEGAPVEEEEGEGEATEHSWGRSLPGMDETAVMDPIEPIELDREAARTRAQEIASEEELPTPVSQSAPVETHEQKQEEPALVPELNAKAQTPDEFDIESARVIDWPLPEDSLQLPIPAEPPAVAKASLVVGGADPALEPPIGSETPIVSTSADPSLETAAEQAAELQAKWFQKPETESQGADPSAEQLEVPSWLPPFQPVTTPADEPVASAALQKSPRAWPSPEKALPVAPAAVLPASGAPEVPAVMPNASEAMTAEAADLAKSTLREAKVSGSLSPEMVEAVVTRIVDRMQPKVLEMVTREILRPVVEALVRREIEKK